MFETMLENVRKKGPVIHSISNYVTANDCSNILLACGGSPIMADDPKEVADITKISSGLNINTGILNERKIDAMLIAGKEANQLNHPIVLDPVGAGISVFRKKAVMKLLEEIRFTVIRGNISEIKSLASNKTLGKGIDADPTDIIREENLKDMVTFAKRFSKKTKAIIAISGPIDIVADRQTAYCIRNGHPMMSSVSGTGCQLSALITAFVSAYPNHPLEATAAAFIAMGLAGEIAYKRLSEIDGNASYRNYIIDAVCKMTGEELERGAKYEIR